MQSQQRELQDLERMRGMWAAGPQAAEYEAKLQEMKQVRLWVLTNWNIGLMPGSRTLERYSIA